MFKANQVLLFSATENAGHTHHHVGVSVARVDLESLGVESLEKEVYAFVVFLFVVCKNLDPRLHGVRARVHEGGAGEVKSLVVGELLGQGHLGIVYHHVAVVPRFVRGVFAALDGVDAEKGAFGAVEALHDFLDGVVLPDDVRDEFLAAFGSVRYLKGDCLVGVEGGFQKFGKVLAPVCGGPRNGERFGVNLEVLQQFQGLCVETHGKHLLHGNHTGRKRVDNRHGHRLRRGGGLGLCREPLRRRCRVLRRRCGFFFGAFRGTLLGGERAAKSLFDLFAIHAVVAGLAAELETGVHEGPAFFHGGDTRLVELGFEFVRTILVLHEQVDGLFCVFHKRLECFIVLNVAFLFTKGCLKV